MRRAPADVVGDTPSARQAADLEPLDLRRKGGVDEHAVTAWLEAHHRPQEKERRSRGPRLRAARRGVLDRIDRLLARVPREGLGQTELKVASGLQDAGADPSRFL